MYLSVVQSAEEVGISARHMRRQAANGRVKSQRHGRTLLIAERQLRAMQRTAHQGRQWNESTKRAALDLLATGATREVIGSERSRLKQRLRGAAASALAGHILSGRTSLRRSASTNDARRHVPTIIAELGLSSEGGLQVLVAYDSALASRRARLGLDDDGDVVVIEGDERHTAVLEALALFAYGDTRECAAAATWLSKAQAAL